MNTREFVLKHPCGLTISRRLAESDVAAVHGTTKQDMGTGFIWYSLPLATINGSKVAMSLCFHKSVLDSLHLALSDPALYGASWSDWSEDRERLRARHTEDWLRALGYMTGTFAWGDVWAGYDLKGASGGGCVRYLSNQSPEPSAVDTSSSATRSASRVGVGSLHGDR